MPATMRKLPGKNKWRVTHNGKISAKETSKENAEKQVRLLNGVAHGMKVRSR